MVKNKSSKKETSLGKIRNINGDFVCIIVTVFVMNKFSGISIYNTYIGNVFYTKLNYKRLEPAQFLN